MRISLNRSLIKANQVNFFDNSISRPTSNKQNDYAYYFKILLEHETELIQEIRKFVGRVIFPPIDEMIFKNYLSGFNLRYFGIKNPSLPNFEGYFAYNNGHPIILFNQDRSYKRQRYTKTHETFHFLQAIDPKFLEIQNEAKTKLPPKLMHKLIERITEKSTALYLMPKDLFIQEYQKGHQTAEELSDIFQVSRQTAEIRLEELGLLPSYNF